MTDVDKFVKEQLIPFRVKALEIFSQKHPHIYSMINTFLAGKQNHMGIQISDNNKIVGEYTFHLEGVNIATVDYGKLSSEIHHPFLGIVKPYAIIERSALEQIIYDAELLKEPFTAIPQYLPAITIKFLR